MGTICEPRTQKSSPKYWRSPMGVSPRTNWPIGYDSTALNGDDDTALAHRLHLVMRAHAAALLGARVPRQAREHLTRPKPHQKGWQAGHDWPDNERDEQEAAVVVGRDDRQRMDGCRDSKPERSE